MAFWNPKPPVERVRTGLRINLGVDERRAVADLLRELRDLLVSGDHPALHRLFPRAYHLPEDAERDAEFHRLMREELVASRLTGIETCLEVLATDRILTEAEGMALLQAVNGVRLVLGTILDVSEDAELDEVPDTDPRIGEYQLYGFLSWLLEWTVRALSR